MNPLAGMYCQGGANVSTGDMMSEFALISNLAPTLRDVITEFSFNIDTNPNLRDVINEFSFINSGIINFPNGRLILETGVFESNQLLQQILTSGLSSISSSSVSLLNPTQILLN